MCPRRFPACAGNGNNLPESPDFGRFLPPMPR
jgi:hypothetical protein